MNCIGLLPSSAGATQYASSSSTVDSPESEQQRGGMVPFVARQSKLIGGPLILEAALKVDRVLARLQSLQGTVAIPTPPVSASVSACLSVTSPNFSRSKSCIGSPRYDHKENDANVIRIHDVLRFSDDFSGKFAGAFNQERRAKYLRRLSRSKTEVFDDKKDPRDPHGEWKHWSSPAGDVHKVISEILMASQFAKEITSMVNACLVQTECLSSDDERSAAQRQSKNRHKKSSSSAKLPSKEEKKITAASQVHPTKLVSKKEDPMHKFRVVTPSDSSTKRRGNAGSRKELLYPKSKATPDPVRPVDPEHELSSTIRKMQSRRSPRSAVDEAVSRNSTRAAAAPAASSRASDMWEAKEITNCGALRSVAESKKGGAMPSSTHVKKVRGSRSPPQASGESKPSSVFVSSPAQLPSVRRIKAGAPASSASSGAAEQAHVVTTAPRRMKASKLPREAMTEYNVAVNSIGSPAETRTSQRSASADPKLSVATFPTAMPSESKSRQTSAAQARRECYVGNLHSGIVRPTLLVQCAQEDDDDDFAAAATIDMGRDDNRFSMQATQIKEGPTKLWKSGSKAVLFSNPTFAPASPPGARPSLQRSITPPVRSSSPRRSTSATRRVRDWLGNALHPGRRSVSPDITRRLSSKSMKSTPDSPVGTRKSLPALISRLPSRGKRQSAASAPRGSIVTQPAPKVGELPLPPCRKAEQMAAAKLGELPLPPCRQAQQLAAAKLAELLPATRRRVQPEPSAASSKILLESTGTHRKTGSPATPAVTTTTAVASEKDAGAAAPPGPVLFSKRQLKELDCNAKSNPGGADHTITQKMERKQNTRTRVAYSPAHSRASDIVSPLKERSLIQVKRGSRSETKAGVLVASSSVKCRAQENAAAGKAGKENVAATAVDCAIPGGNVLGKSWSVGSARSMYRSVSTSKVRTGPSLLKRAKDWVRTQTPFRDRPHKTSDLS